MESVIWDTPAEPFGKENIKIMRRALLDDFKHPGPDRLPVLSKKDQEIYEACLAIARNNPIEIVSNGKTLDFSQKTC